MANLEAYKYLHRFGMAWLFVGLLSVVIIAVSWPITLPLTQPGLERVYSSITQLYGLGLGMAGYLLGLAHYIKRKIKRKSSSDVPRAMPPEDASNLLRKHGWGWALIAVGTLGLQLLIPAQMLWVGRIYAAFDYLIALSSLLAGQLLALAAYCTKRQYQS